MFNVKQTQNGGAIVSDGDILVTPLDSSLTDAGFGMMRTPISSTIILSRPEGPNELFTTLAMACVARTLRERYQYGRARPPGQSQGEGGDIPFCSRTSAPVIFCPPKTVRDRSVDRVGGQQWGMGGGTHRECPHSAAARRCLPLWFERRRGGAWQRNRHFLDSSTVVFALRILPAPGGQPVQMHPTLTRGAVPSFASRSFPPSFSPGVRFFLVCFGLLP